MTFTSNYKYIDNFPMHPLIKSSSQMLKMTSGQKCTSAFFDSFGPKERNELSHWKCRAWCSRTQFQLKYVCNSGIASERHHEISSDHLNYRPVKYVSLESVIETGSELAGKAFSQTLYIASSILYLSLEIGSLHWPSVNLTVQATTFFSS